jgi:hypothetical protein
MNQDPSLGKRIPTWRNMSRHDQLALGNRRLKTAIQAMLIALLRCPTSSKRAAQEGKGERGLSAPSGIDHALMHTAQRTCPQPAPALPTPLPASAGRTAGGKTFLMHTHVRLALPIPCTGEPQEPFGGGQSHMPVCQARGWIRSSDQNNSCMLDHTDSQHKWERQHSSHNERPARTAGLSSHTSLTHLLNLAQREPCCLSLAQQAQLLHL